MTWTGFAAAAWRRAVLALLYGLAVAAAVWAVEADGDTASTASTASTPSPVPAATSVDMDLSAEATFPVVRWTVLADGQPVSGQDGHGVWRGRMTAHEILIQAERADPGDLAPGAVRVRIGGREVLGWGEGTVSVTVRP